MPTFLHQPDTLTCLCPHGSSYEVPSSLLPLSKSFSPFKAQLKCPLLQEAFPFLPIPGGPLPLAPVAVCLKSSCPSVAAEHTLPHRMGDQAFRPDGKLLYEGAWLTPVSTWVLTVCVAFTRKGWNQAYNNN